MDADNRLRKKRTHADSTKPEVQVPESLDLNKKRKLSESTSKVVDEKVKTDDKQVEEKPWEGKKEEEEDYRWNICENCQWSD